MTPSRSAATPVVDARHISFRYRSGFSGKGRLILDRADLSIMPGEILGLSGPSGIGKSTLGDVLLGLGAPWAGQVFWEGRPVYNGQKFIPKKMRRFFQKIFQDPSASFPPFQTVGQALLDVIAHYGLAGEGREPGPVISRMISREILPMGLTPDMLDRYPCQLSGGEMQRFALARIFLLSPRFIVADEPTSRLDPAVQALIIRLIADFSRTRGCAVLLISHDQGLLRAVCPRIIHLPLHKKK